MDKDLFEKGVFGVGIIALKNRPIKAYKTFSEAKAVAEGCGTNFLVNNIIEDEDDITKDRRYVYAWNFCIKSRQEFLDKYALKGSADKLTVLRGCSAPLWIELTTNCQNYLFPLNKEIPDDVVEEINKLRDAWFEIVSVGNSGKHYVSVF